MAKETKQVRVWLEMWESLPELATMMSEEKGTDIDMTDAASIAIKEAFERRAKEYNSIREWVDDQPENKE